MIIKRNRANQLSPQTHASGRGDPVLGDGAQSLPSWTEEAVEAGLAPERRVSDRSNDRRRGYRRIEDKHLISKAYEEANAIRENAQREGYEAGLDEARESIAELRGTIDALLGIREEALMSAADEIAAIAIEVSERIIKTEVACDDALVMNLVRDTIQKAGRSNKTILIKVHPDDSQLVKRALKEDAPPNLQAELIVMDDPTVDPGSCVLETNSGMIDASFSTQLQILKQLFGVQ